MADDVVIEVLRTKLQATQRLVWMLLEARGGQIFIPQRILEGVPAELPPLHETVDQNRYGLLIANQRGQHGS